MYKSKSALFNADHRDELGLQSGDYSKPKIYPYFKHLYNMRMNGIDVLDQLVSSHERSGPKEHWEMAAHETSFKLIEVISYQMYQNYCKINNLNSNYTHWEFKQSIAIELIKRRGIRTSTITLMSSDVIIELHPTCVMPKRGHCKFLIDNPAITSERCHPKVICDARTSKGCMQCSYKGTVGLYLFGKHMEEHQRLEK